MKSKLTQLQIIAIEQAAAGCISDPINEWPILISALRILEVPSNLSVAEIKKRCKLIINSPSWNL